MRARLFGQITRPAVAAIGVWDPVLKVHRDLYASLTSYARRSAFSSLVIAIDPDPARYFRGVSECPVYNDVHMRMSLILSCGLDGVLCVRFVSKDIHRTAAEFFSTLDRHVQIGELWLGAQQTLGRLQGGTLAAIMKAAEERRINLSHLPAVRLDTGSVRKLLKEGRIKDASSLVGHPPMRSRPRSGTLRLAWLPGIYQAAQMVSPDATPERSLLKLCVVPQAKGVPRVSWPDKGIRYLAFISGPGDN